MTLDVEVFVGHLRKHAEVSSLGSCAKFVRAALEAGGGKTTGYPGLAKDWDPILMRNGFRVIAVAEPDRFPFLTGDIMIMQPYKGGNSAGHIAAFDGKNWISDFVQRDFWAGPGYRKQRPSYVVYRR